MEQRPAARDVVEFVDVASIFIVVGMRAAALWAAGGHLVDNAELLVAKTCGYRDIM